MNLKNDDPDIIANVFLIVVVTLTAFAIINGIVALIRHRIHRNKAITDYETDLIRQAARRDTYEEIARFASEYYGDPYFSSKIRQLWFIKESCPECDGRGKKWQNSKWKCEHCWGTGKHLKE